MTYKPIPMKSAHDGHSQSEQLVYKWLWAAGKRKSSVEFREVEASVAALAHRTRLSRSTIIKTLKSLQDKLSISVIREHQAEVAIPRIFAVFSEDAIVSRRNAAGLTHATRTSGVRLHLGEGCAIPTRKPQPGTNRATQEHQFPFSSRLVNDQLAKVDRNEQSANLTHNPCAHIMCIMNITLSIDDQLLERARKRASEMGTTVNQYVRDRLSELAGEEDIDAQIARFRELSGRGDSSGWTWNREEIYEERLGRYGKS